MINRTVYKKPPLDHVICQLLFPTILRINRDEPVEFQEKIRKKYPIYSKRANSTAIDVNMMINTPNVYQSQIVNHIFSSTCGNKISLTQNYVALTAYNYRGWEDFKKELLEIITILDDVYKIPFYDRIGLRYIDVFVRSKYGAERKKWPELIKNELLGPFSLDGVSDQFCTNISDVVLKDGIKVKVITRIVINTDPEIKNEDKERCLMIDTDSMIEKRIEKNECETKLDEIHNTSSYLLRSSITDEMHKLMGPTNG